MANANEPQTDEKKPDDASGEQKQNQPVPPPFAQHYNELRHRQFQVHFTDGRAVAVNGDDAFAIAKAINEDQPAYEILELDGNHAPTSGAILYLKHVTAIELVEHA